MKLMDKATKQVYEVLYQQYLSGLYVAIYKNGHIYDQFGLDCSIDDFIKSLEEQFIIIGR